MTGKPEQHSLEDVKRLLRSLEETTADDGQTGLRRGAPNAPRRDPAAQQIPAGSPSPPGRRDPPTSDTVLSAQTPLLSISPPLGAATQQPGDKRVIIGAATLFAGMAIFATWYFVAPGDDGAPS